jgi:hypothetical protein
MIVRWGGIGVSSRRKTWFCSGLRVLAAHVQARWGMGLVLVCGGHESLDARWGVGSRRKRGRVVL